MATATHRIVIMGSGGVGKTSLISRFMTGQFPYGYYPTIENVYKHQVQMPDGSIHTLELMDTAGLHIVPSMQKLNIKSGKAFALVYDISNVMTFLNALDLVDEINVTKGLNKRTPIILVGNKCDTVGNREVEAGEGQKESAQRNCAFMEVSAKDNTRVTDAFMQLLSMIVPDSQHQVRKSNKKGKLGKQVKTSKSRESIGKNGGELSPADTINGKSTDQNIKSTDTGKKGNEENETDARKTAGEHENNQTDGHSTKTKGKSCVLL